MLIGIEMSSRLFIGAHTDPALSGANHHTVWKFTRSAVYNNQFTLII